MARNEDDDKPWKRLYHGDQHETKQSDQPEVGMLLMFQWRAMQTTRNSTDGGSSISGSSTGPCCCWA